MRQLALKQLHNAFIIFHLILSFFLKRNYHKIAHRNYSIVVLTFTAWFHIESAVSGLKGEQRP